MLLMTWAPPGARHRRSSAPRSPTPPTSSGSSSSALSPTGARSSSSPAPATSSAGSAGAIRSSSAPRSARGARGYGSSSSSPLRTRLAQSSPQSSSEAAARVALNPAYTFERFVIGPGSQFAHAAALAVAEAPGEAYNPLFLHGPPGLGKTHLLGAIANYLHHHNPELTVHYTTAECFTNEFVASLQGTGIEEFKRHYRGANVLLIDDVQFLQGKARTADEFFHTFNALYEAGAQLVLTADRLPGELSALAERLRDRFEWGLTVALEPPDLPTRLVFLGNLARERSEQVAPEALRAIASRAISNLRLLEGALTRILALASLTSSAITPEAVDRALPGAGASRSRREARDCSNPEDRRHSARRPTRAPPLTEPCRPNRPCAPTRHVPQPRAHRSLPP